MSIKNRELTKREIAQREQIFLRDLGAPDIAGSKPPEVSKPPEPPLAREATNESLDDFAPEAFVRENFVPENFVPENFVPDNFAPENFAPEAFVRPSHVSVPLKPKSRAHPVALTCLGIVTAVSAFLFVERSTEPVSPPIPPKEPSAISEVDKSTLPPVSADNPPPVVDVPLTPSTPAPVPESTPVPVPEIAKAPPKPVLPATPRNDAPRARPPAPSVSRQPPATARLDPPLSQRPPVVAGAPEPPPRPAADPPAVPPAAAAASEPRPITEPGLAPAPAPAPSPPPVAPPAAAALPPASPPSAAPGAAPPAAAAASASASAIESNTKGIENTLARYRKAFSALDAGAAHAVWPTVDQRNLSRAFERLEQQDVSFEGCKIDVIEARAEANCRGTASYVPRVGNRTPRIDRRSWRFSLVKVREEWLIGAVEAR